MPKSRPTILLRHRDAHLPRSTIRIRLEGHQVVLDDGEVLFDRAPRCPFVDSARLLLGRGYAAERVLALVDDDGLVRLAAPIGYAAHWTVSEGDKHGPNLAPWRPAPAGLWGRSDDKSP